MMTNVSPLRLKSVPGYCCVSKTLIIETISDHDRLLSEKPNNGTSHPKRVVKTLDKEDVLNSFQLLIISTKMP